ncbi:Acyl-CoA thioester hydrolase YbgC [Aureliella helgolandensis]|uniref:Acyl-CoA thioester hydrolase YbgC n=2 Tax=Aureliella helgolandensis TaxID=2527968 RepID=A0A518GFX3_9BACT|nr:Acyl-CoA thioester hydrolase YbgC [Aureliella helgolandensis]
MLKDNLNHVLLYVARLTLPMKVEHSLEIRVRYNETDGQGRVHHAQYLNYFERGRVELLRSLGHSYRDFEASGLMLVVSEMNVRYLGAAEFDDLLRVTTSVLRTRGVRIEHAYEIVKPAAGLLASERGTPESATDQPIVKATSVIACVDRTGKVQRLPKYMRIPTA